MRVLAIAALVVVGCSDPTLAVQVEIPDAYRDQIANVVLFDYELDDLTCDAIAFGDVPAQKLDGALTTKVKVTGSSAGISGLSRTEHKVLVAHGLDANDQLLVAGCVAVDLVDGADAVTINTEGAAIVTIDPRRPDQAFNDAPISVRVLDGLGKPLARRWIVSRVFGPKGLPGGSTGAAGCPRQGQGVDACEQTDDTGNRALTLTVPTLPGPVMVQVHVEWARTQPPLVAGFTTPLAYMFDLRGAALAPPASCAAVRAGAGVQLACLATVLGGGLEIQRFGWNGSAIVKLPGSVAATGAIGLVAIPDGATDRLVAIAENGDWIDGASGQTVAHVNGPGGAKITAAQLVPACGKTAFVAIEFAGGSVQGYTSTGATLASFASTPANGNFDLGPAGCLSDVGAPTTTYRTLVLTGKNAQAALARPLVDCTKCAPLSVAYGDGGFVTGASGEARLALGQIDLSGVIVNEWMLDPSATDPQKQLVSPITHDAVSVPERIVGGDFDGDQIPDRAWLIFTGNLLAPSGRLQIVLGATVDGAPITGLSAESKPRPEALVVGRFDADATDDIALVAAGQLTMVLTGKPAGGP